MQDLYVDLDDATVYDADYLFGLKMQPSRVAGEVSKAGKIHDVHFEMGKEKKVLQRNIYSVMDLLSDIGGVQSLLFAVFAFTVTCLNTDHFEERLVGQLYSYRKNRQVSNELSDAEAGAAQSKPSFFRRLNRLYGFKKCCCPHRRKRGELKALNKAK